MTATDTTSEAAMLPRMIQMVMSVAAAGIMAHPLPIGMHVGSFGMSCLVVELAVFLGRMRSVYLRRTVLGNVLMAAADLRPAACMFFMLCHG